MKIVTTRDKIRNVASAWKRLYGNKTHSKILKKLEALDVETATEEDVANIIGNNCWTASFCDECSEYADAIVIVGEEAGYDTATAKLCMKCLQKAYDLCKERKLL